MVTLLGGIKRNREHHCSDQLLSARPAGKTICASWRDEDAVPDLRHHTTRDYGNRVGVDRILKVLARAGVKVIFPINAEVATGYPGLVVT